MKTPKTHATPDSQHTSSASPDTTPVPGAGSWHWDPSLPGWRANDASATPAPQPATTPTTTPSE